MVWSQNGRQPLEEEILDGRGNGVHRDVQLVNVNVVILVKLLEEQINVSPISRHPIEPFRVKTFLFDEGDSLLQEDRNWIVS